MFNSTVLFQKKFLKTKFSGITEYLAEMNKTKNYTMLIYNKSLSVSLLQLMLLLKKFQAQFQKRKY